MILTRPPWSRRTAGVAPLTALLLIPLLAMMAFAVDVGWIAETNEELQNAADAAALAAAEQLPPYYVQYYTPGSDQGTALSNARTQANSFAQNYAGYHKAGNCTSVVLDTTNDVVYGYQDASTPFTTTVPAGTFPNTVQVTLRLNGGAGTNAKLGLFFGPVLGMPTVDVTATARATIYNGEISDFSGPTGTLLPATVDTQIWDSFVTTGKGSLPDYGYTAPTSNAPSGVPAPAVGNAPQILVVPDPNGRPGGWNYLSLNSSSNSNADFKGWFSNGLGQSDLDALHSAYSPWPAALPLPAQAANADNATYFWKGAPGDRGNSEPFPPPGSIRLLPLYQHVPVDQSPGSYVANLKDEGTWASTGGASGRGQNAWFNVVRFVAVVVTDTSNGLSVQPAAVTDPNLILTGLQAAGKPASSTQFKTAFAAPKLSY
jgi:Flp pilus assembly protein TadG